LLLDKGLEAVGAPVVFDGHDGLGGSRKWCDVLFDLRWR
jgi:hypothetical protein